VTYLQEGSNPVCAFFRAGGAKKVSPTAKPWGEPALRTAAGNQLSLRLPHKNLTPSVFWA
jgi:hypothetical protein